MLIRWFLNIIVLFLVSYIVPGIKFNNFWSLIVTSVVLGLLNAIVRPVLILLTLPVNILTLGLFTLVINAFVFWLVGTIVKGFEIKNFTSAFIAALVYWLIILLINYISERYSVS